MAQSAGGGPLLTSRAYGRVATMIILVGCLGRSESCQESWCDASFATEHCAHEGCLDCAFCANGAGGEGTCATWCDAKHHCAGPSRETRCAGCSFCGTGTGVVPFATSCAEWCAEGAASSHCADGLSRCSGCAFCAAVKLSATRDAAGASFACEPWCDAHSHCADGRCKDCADVIEQCGAFRCTDWCSEEHAGKHCIDERCRTCEFCARVVR